MSLSPVATERHVDEAIRLFNHSTMNAVQSGMGRCECACVCVMAWLHGCIGT